jgi:Uma2 family endonuclease
MAGKTRKRYTAWRERPLYEVNEEKLTYRDYCSLPDDGHRYEIIDGELYNAPSPYVDHQRMLRNLARILDAYCTEKAQGEVLYAPVDIVFSDHDVVQPDILWVSKERRKVITKKNLQGAPDLVVEISSPFTREKDERIKRKLYGKFGVREYWLLDPERGVLSVYRISGRVLRLAQKYADIETFESPLFPGLKLDLKKVFTEGR